MPIESIRDWTSEAAVFADFRRNPAASGNPRSTGSRTPSRVAGFELGGDVCTLDDDHLFEDAEQFGPVIG